MEGVVYGVGAGFPTQRTTHSSSYLTPWDSLWKHCRSRDHWTNQPRSNGHQTPSPNQQCRIQCPWWRCFWSNDIDTHNKV